MADEETPESPEQQADEAPPAEEALAEDAATEAEEQPSEVTGADASAAGPVAEEDTSSSQAAGEEPISTPPAEEAPEPDTEAQAAGSPDTPDPEVALAADAAVEGEEKQPAKGSDLPPGADLEPIAVEPDAQLSAEEKARLEAEEEERASREAELEGDGATEESGAARAPAQMESGSRFVATGKRKRSIARVILTPGEGRIEVNARSLEDYFPRPLHQTMARQPLASAGYEDSVDVRIRVHGGGISGQAGAVRHGIARALTEIDPELRGDLKRRGFLTRDARVKERRKAGLKKARKKPQFSKR